MSAFALTGGAHVFTVDVEEYFQVHAFASNVSMDDWDTLPSRVEQNVDEFLDLLGERDVYGTFFVLGWIADRHPDVIRRLAAAGHEIASHGWSHRRLTDMSRDEVREELRSSKRILEDLSGQSVRGFRAPGFSLTPGMEWVFDALLEEGYLYDSSLFPIRRPAYGYPGIPDAPHLISRNGGTLLELPLATWNWQGLRLPAAGGGYFRQFPYEVTRRALQQNAVRGVPATFYLHNWEVDVDQPRLSVPLLSRIRHYRGIQKVRDRLQRLLSEFAFTSVARRFDLRESGLAGDTLASVLSS
jgi:polysaccharide deacetylase family protein (PEP-CTERM system associated)